MGINSLGPLIAEYALVSATTTPTPGVFDEDEKKFHVFRDWALLALIRFHYGPRQEIESPIVDDM
jgi:hypothetical protein